MDVGADVKLIRWVLADGSEIRSLSGRREARRRVFAKSEGKGRAVAAQDQGPRRPLGAAERV